MINRLNISTSQHTEFIDITSDVRQAVTKSGIRNGLAVVYIPHTTAGVTINEHADPSVVDDIIATLEKNIPWSDRYHHSEGNSAAHIKASLLGSSVQVVIESGALILGTWQGIFFCEFDGPRSRKIIVTTLESSK